MRAAIVWAGVVAILSGGCVLLPQSWSVPSCNVPTSVGQRVPSADEVAGHYAAVSESEWNLEVWLNADSTAEVLREIWEAGKYAERTTVRWRGSWELSGAYIELRYRDICETLQFHPAMSFAEFGAEGAAPGIHGAHAYISSAPLLGRSLWSAEHLRELGWTR